MHRIFWCSVVENGRLRLNKVIGSTENLIHEACHVKWWVPTTTGSKGPILFLQEIVAYRDSLLYCEDGDLRSVGRFIYRTGIRPHQRPTGYGNYCMLSFAGTPSRIGKRKKEISCSYDQTYRYSNDNKYLLNETSTVKKRRSNDMFSGIVFSMWG